MTTGFLVFKLMKMKSFIDKRRDSLETKFGPKPLLDPVQIKKLYDKGHHDYPFYKEKFNVSHKTVYRAFKKLGIQLEGRPITAFMKQNKEQIIAYYEETKSIRDTTEEFELNIKTLRSYLQKWGVFVNEQPRYTANYNFFERIDTEEKAYWLGFIAADGTLNNKRSLKIALAIEDIEHLNKFNASLESTYPIRTYERGPNNVWKINAQPISEVCITSQKMFDDLIDKGITRRKTHTIKFPCEEKLPKNLRVHYIRGVFDGDGTITRLPRPKYSKDKKIGHYKNSDGSLKFDYSFSIMGNIDHIEPIQKILMEEVGMNQTKLIHSKHHTENIVSVAYCGNNNVKKIGKWLYKDATIYLDRKLHRFEDCFKL